jgi:hypothetical protein
MTPTPSVPPPGVRTDMPVQAMRLKPLPRRDPDEARRLTLLFRRRPVPRRRTA